MKLFKQNKLISELMTKLVNEEIINAQLRKEVAVLKDKVYNLTFELHNAQCDLIINQVPESENIEFLRLEVAQLKHDLENMRILAKRFEDELNTSRKAIKFEQELSRRLMEQLEKGN